MRSMKTLTKIAGIGMVGALALSGCADGLDSSDSEKRTEAHQGLEESQPAKTLDYSPTRETINFWIDTWDEPGKLSYVYLQNTDGEVIGYYVLEGLPVSYCAQISHPQKTVGSSSRSVVKAPANDGAYYGDGNCDTYYGKDATTGAYIEYTAGMGINVLLYDQPLPNQGDADPLGPTSTDDVESEESEGDE